MVPLIDWLEVGPKKIQVLFRFFLNNKIGDCVVLKYFLGSACFFVVFPLYQLLSGSRQKRPLKGQP